jgi:glucokinase
MYLGMMSYAIGIDLGATNIKYGIVDAEGNILHEGLKATVNGSSVPGNLEIVITELKELGLAKGLPISGIGIGVPGIIDGGIVTGCAGNLPEIDGMALGAVLERYAQLPVVMDNDANLMGFAELQFGAAKGLTDVVFLTVGTGIGGALLLNGKLYGGHGNRGAELGHIRVADPGAPCTCGSSGCLEAHASVSALIRDYLDAAPEERQEDEPDGRRIFSRYLKGDSDAILAMNRHFRYLGSGIASLINIFSPQKIILGGGITEAGEPYIHSIRQHALRMSMKETSEHTLIEPALLGNKAGFLGAAALVFAL